MYLIQKEGWIFQVDVCSWNIPHWSHILSSSQPFFHVLHIHRQEQVVVFDVLKTFQCWHVASILLHMYIFPSSFPKQSCQEGDQIGFVQEETPILQLCPIVLVFDWVVASSDPCGLSFSGDLSNLGASDMCTCVQADAASLASSAIP